MATILTKDIVTEALRNVVDPEIQLSVTDLGLVYDVDISNDGESVTVRMTLTTPYCPYGPALISDVKRVLSELPGVKQAEVIIVWDPPWDPKTMVSDEIKDKLGIW
jgi:metal-sulfur cluster biosynthetic enzyme